MSDTNQIPEIGSKKAKQKANDEKRRAMRKAAFETVLKKAKEALDSGVFSGDEADELNRALFNLRPLRSAQPVAKITVQSSLKALFGDKKFVTGSEAYAAFRAGTLSTPDVRKLITLAIKTGKPEDRLWIEYDAQNDVYNLLGTGPTAPFGWMGYVPIDAAVEAQA